MEKDLKPVLESVLGESVSGNMYGNGKLETESGKKYFLKSGTPSRTYQCEANGLQELAKAQAVKTASVVAVGDTYILTEYLDKGKEKRDFFEDFGRSFAGLHCYHSDSFGFYEDNFIGANPQLNIAVGDEKTNWAAFYFNKRLLFQYKLAEKEGNASSRLRSGFSKLEYRIEKILNGSEEPPCLLHGDLWAGNYLADNNGDAVVIDPAVYYGHREADLAMTKLFGGFTQAFYKAYMEEYPLPEEWQYRENIYKLYHVMNHLNIFGRSYLPEAEFIVEGYGR